MFTSDMEFMRCDMCYKYLHKDIFCDHRRICKGPDSTELKPQQCKNIQQALNKEDQKKAGLSLSLSALEKKSRSSKQAALLADHFAHEEQKRAEAASSSRSAEELLAELDSDRFGDKGWQK